jgi:hypothetical protein
MRTDNSSCASAALYSPPRPIGLSFAAAGGLGPHSYLIGLRGVVALAQESQAG